MYFSINLFLLINLTSCSYDKTTVTQGSEFDNTWDFNSGANFEFDENLIEVKNGKAQLKALDLEHSGLDFNNGNHVGSSGLSNKILLNNDRMYGSLDITWTPEFNSILHYWPLDNSWNDVIGGGDCTPLNSPNFTVDSRVGSHSVKLNGLDQGANCGQGSDLTEFSISAWVNFNESPGLNINQIIARHQTAPYQYNYFFDIFDNGKLRIGFYTGSGWKWAATDPLIWTSSEWYHVTATVKGTSTELYVNGNLQIIVENTIYGPPTPGTGSDEIQIGHLSNANFFPGHLDEIAVWSKKLSSGQVFKIYSRQRIKFASETALSPEWTPKWDNIVGYWKMDGNWQDSSGNGNHGVTGTASNFSTKARVGAHSANFTANSGEPFVLSGLDSNLNGISEFATSFWVRAISTSTTERLMSDNASNSFVIRKSGATGLRIISTSGFIATSQTCTFCSDNNGRWYHHVITAYEGKWYWYVNGLLNISGVTAGNLSFPSSLNIGGQNSSSSVFSGNIDDLAFWNTGLSNDKVSIIYNRQKQKYASHFDSEVLDLGNQAATWPDLSWVTSLPFGKELVGDYDNDGTPDSESSSDYPGLSGDLSDGLVGYWGFNEIIYGSAPSGHDLADLSINSNHGSESGAILFNEKGRLSNSYRFDGQDDFITIPDSSAYNFDVSDNFSINLWVKTSELQVDTAGLNNTILEKIGSSGSYPFSIRISNQNSASPGRVSLSRRDGVITSALNSSQSINNGKWNMISVIKDGNALSIHINGEISSTGSDIVSLSTQNLDPIYIGARNGNFLFSGNIDEVGIWNRNLTTIEVQQLYRRGANRVKLQVKSCVDSSCNCKSYGAGGSEADCDGDTILNSDDNDDIHKADFVGPGGDGTTYFSELYNRNATDISYSCALNTTDPISVCSPNEIILAGSSKPKSPEFLNIDYSQFINPTPNRYAQYRVYMEADENTACGGEPCLPELTSVSLNPSGGTVYASDYVEVRPNNPIHFTRLARITINADSCAMFRLARAGVEYFYDSGSWAPAVNNADRSSASDLEKHALQFASQFGPGDLEVIGYLKSDPSGNSQCTIDEIDIGYK